MLRGSPFFRRGSPLEVIPLQIGMIPFVDACERIASGMSIAGSRPTPTTTPTDGPLRFRFVPGAHTSLQKGATF